MAIAETENNFLVGASRFGASDRERVQFEREEVVEQAVEAWRVNPLARRIVELTTQYVVGSGLRISAADDATQAFIDEFYAHPLNGLELRINEWCDELTRTGEIFILVSTDPSGMSYVRAVASDMVGEIQVAENDYTQELAFPVKTSTGGGTPTVYPGALRDPGRDEGGGFSTIMLHYAINRPVGTVRGESDLAPLLRWLSRYSGWLEDRARLNRYRNTFLFTVRSKFASEAERLARQTSLATNPPTPGSILVVDETEEWGVINPQLSSNEAAEDGLALKKMIAAGAGLPMHFLAEPEGSTRTTAEAAGGPTYRRFEQRQKYFCSILGDILRVVVDRRRMVDSRLAVKPGIKVVGGDLSARDNAALAMAASAIGQLFMDLRDRQVIDDEELLRVVYKFSSENMDLKDLLERGKKAGKPILPVEVKPPAQNGNGGQTNPGIKISPDGEPRGNAAI